MVINGVEIYNAVMITAFCIGQMFSLFLYNLCNESNQFFKVFFDAPKKYAGLILERCKKIGLKRISKFGSVYLLYLAIVLTFDYVYIPWLAIKFRYLTMVPLFFSLFAISWLGLLLYRFFREDVFFMEKINAWLSKDNSKFRIIRAIKKKISENPRFIFAAISIEWSPLHSYLFFKRDEQDNVLDVAKSFALGSLYCAFFWGVVIDIAVLLWDLVKLLWGLLKLLLQFYL